MVVYCCVPGCQNSNYSDENIRLFRFPAINKRLHLKDQEILRKRRTSWLNIMKDTNITEENAKWRRICSSHFISGEPANFKDIDHPDWIPSQNLKYSKYSKVKESTPSLRLTRFHRAKRRSDAKILCLINEAKENKTTADTSIPVNSTQTEVHIPVESTADTSTPVNSTQTEVHTAVEVETEVETGVYVQTDITNSYISSLEDELKRRNEEIYMLSEVVSQLTYSEAFFEGDDKKMKYFTGLPNLAVVKLILSRIDESLSALQVKKLCNFQKLLLTLMKLRHNESFVGLGYKFRISTHQASYIFKHVVIILELAFHYMVHWPDRDSLRNLTPQCFREKFGDKVAVIIDCFEITIQRPASLKAKSETFSNYKNNYTAKYLIGITPHGYISFISNGWGGRVSDKVITEQSGFIDNLLPGDIVLADRGFTIKEIVSTKYAELNLPAFTRGLPQLDPRDVEGTRRIASVRIHVERVIATIRNKFKILKGPIPINLLKSKYEGKEFLDYVVRLCCIFVNMCEPVVPSFDHTPEPSFEEQNDVSYPESTSH